MIDSYATIVLERLPKVIPKREVSTFARVQRPERIRIAHSQHRTIAGSRLGLKQSIQRLSRRTVTTIDFVSTASSTTCHIILGPKAKQMLSVKQLRAIESPWTTMPPVRLGKVPSGLGTADLFVTISDDEFWRPANGIQHFSSTRIVCDGAFGPILTSCTAASFRVAVPKVQ